MDWNKGMIYGAHIPVPETEPKDLIQECCHSVTVSYYKPNILQYLSHENLRDMTVMYYISNKHGIKLKTIFLK
jgi:hypothetical protein